MTYNDFMAIAETHYTKHCKDRRMWKRIANAEYNEDATRQRAIEEMVADTFPRKAKQSADRLLNIICDVDWFETKYNREVA